MRRIELLAPAKNIKCGIAAIDHGADAVYVGADRFSARAAAGNSIDEIAKLVCYARPFHVKIYVAINTILTDEQLPEAEKLIQELYAIGVDAIIIQDMGILKLDLPPVAIHASTQTDNRTAQKVQFLQNAGFSRVVLARELTLRQITDIAQSTNVELEAFVHGALCVSYSGQCYISQAMTGRSANRGACAQYCRLPYQLYDAKGQQLAKDQHLLSLKDLDLSDSLEELLEAGVMSLKIEGRLKDVDYVKNITAYYRQKLDAILSNPKYQSQYSKASSGNVKLLFEPNPLKSFRRSATDYFTHGRHKGIHQPETPKSLGEPIGPIVSLSNRMIIIDTNIRLNNGDGLCCIEASGALTGFRVNRAEKNHVYVVETPDIKPGTMIYRNYDHEFGQLLGNKTAERRVQVKLHLTECETGFRLSAIDEDGISVMLEWEAEKQQARNAESAEDLIVRQLKKAGATIFNVTEVSTSLQMPWYFTASVLNNWRREILDLLENERVAQYKREAPAPRELSPYPENRLSYLGNVTIQKAYEFYSACGVKEIAPGFELVAPPGVPLMFTRHCIKYEMGWCPREGGTYRPAEPLSLENNGHRYQLSFDCVACEMRVSLATT